MFDIVLSSENCLGWYADRGLLTTKLANNLFLQRGQWGVALSEVSFTSSIVNIPNYRFKVGGDFFDVPASHKDTVDELLSEMNAVAKMKMKWSISGNQIIFKLPVNVRVELDNVLSQMLGFVEQPEILNGSVSQYHDIWHFVPNLAVCWDGCERSLIGGKMSQIIKVLSGDFKTVSYGQTMTENFWEYSVVDVIKEDVTQINLVFTTISGKNIHFLPNTKITVQLRFFELDK